MRAQPHPLTHSDFPSTCEISTPKTSFNFTSLFNTFPSPCKEEGSYEFSLGYSLLLAKAHLSVWHQSGTRPSTVFGFSLKTSLFGSQDRLSEVISSDGSENKFCEQFRENSIFLPNRTCCLKGCSKVHAGQQDRMDGGIRWKLWWGKKRWIFQVLGQWVS